MSPKKRYFWIVFLYFFSGIPLGFFYTFLPVFFRLQGVDLIKIGLLSSAGIFWSLKPLWAPLVDRYHRKKTWMGLSLLGMSLSIFLISSASSQTELILLYLSLLTFFSALYDTALDGLLIELVPKEELGKANGFRLSAYRVAMIFSGGVLTAVSEYLNFQAIFHILTLLTFLAGLVVLSSRYIALNPTERTQKSLIETYLNPLRELLQRKGIALILIFIAIYKAGDALLGGMIYPFWVDRGFSRVEIGLISGTIGSILTILGALIGGYYTSKRGLKESLLVLGLLQAFSNLGYALVALPFVDKKWVYLASFIESFTGGLGTSAFVTFLTTLCHRNFTSSHYALFSTLFSITLVISRSLSGFGAKTLGYAPFFALTFVVALIPLLMLPYLTKRTDFPK